MQELTGDISLTLAQAKDIARALSTVARADGGVGPAERELITAFYTAACADGGEVPEDLDTHVWSADESRAVQDSEASREALLRSVLLMAWLDGACAPSERGAIDEIVQGLGISAETRRAVEAGVLRMLLAPFVLEHFPEARYTAGQHLGLGADEVDQLLAEA